LAIERDFACTMSHNAVFGYVLWDIAQDLFICYGPYRMIWLCAMGHSANPITRAKKYTTVFQKLVISFKGTVMIKSVCISTVITRAYVTQVFNPWYLQTKLVPRSGLAQNEFRIRITRRIRIRIRKNSLNGVDWWKSQRSKISRYGPFKYILRCNLHQFLPHYHQYIMKSKVMTILWI
jgi:hypothetical protein